MTSKKFIFIIIGILISASLVLGIFISKPASDISENPEFGKYISAYTYGVISKTATSMLRSRNISIPKRSLSLLEKGVCVK